MMFFNGTKLPRLLQPIGRPLLKRQLRRLSCKAGMEQPTASQLPEDPDFNESLFRHTSRRWILNEGLRLKERYVRFNVPELMRAAARAVNQQHCTRIAKLAEGGFNKIFLLTMDDGQEVIARLPTQVAGPSHYTTASEVATMDFLRGVLGVPVPRVLTYSATAHNPVEAEYIIMERFHGESLASRWLELSIAEMKDVLKQLIDVEKRIFSYKFPAYGSLYYEHDVAGVPHAGIPMKATAMRCMKDSQTLSK